MARFAATTIARDTAAQAVGGVVVVGTIEAITEQQAQAVAAREI